MCLEFEGEKEMNQIFSEIENRTKDKFLKCEKKKKEKKEYHHTTRDYEVFSYIK